MTTYILIDDGPYPTFFLTTKKSDRAAAVQLQIDKAQVESWKLAIKEYARVQKEMHAAVDHYEPTALSGLKSKAKKPTK